MGFDGCDVTGRAELGRLERLLSGINPAVMKSRYGLKCHRWGSAWLSSIGSHRCGATCQGEEGAVEEGLAAAWTALPRVAFIQAVVAFQGWT